MDQASSIRMALFAHCVGIDRKRVTVGRVMVLIRRRAFLHMAADALVREPKCMRGRRKG